MKRIKNYEENSQGLNIKMNVYIYIYWSKDSWKSKVKFRKVECEFLTLQVLVFDQTMQVEGQHFKEDGNLKT